MFRLKAFVRENFAQRERLCDYDCRWRCSRKFERTSGNGRFDVKKEVRPLCSVCVDRLVDVLLDWGSSSSPFAKGMSHHQLGYSLLVDVMMRSADLVPVFSFGENDVPLSYIAFYPI